ncbi:FAD-dependent monooxygenase [Candidatus Pelagibacter bacterium]|nr:FAD-dependent monooxygenase [Candidatus Pelagibacter bacterium]MDA9618987.1 FAD-dependent monooxygenase [Candidatus Pelagibacter bacterium]
MKKKLAIIGAGIAGLTLANFLKKFTDHEFMVYEREESLSLEEGYGIQLATNSIKILNKIDFKKINNEKIFNPKTLDFYSIQNEKICDLDLSKFNNEETKYTTLQRSTLIEFLKEDIYTQHLRFGKKIKEVSELKDKILIKFDDNTNDLVDFVFAADGIFSNTRSFFEKKKSEPKFKKAIAARVILKSKSELNISDENISLMLGSNSHIVLYPINKKKELNLVCIIRCKKFDPNKTKQLITDLVLKQNPKLKNIFDNEIKSWPLYFSPKILSSSNKKVFYIGDAFNGFLPTLAQGAGQSIESAYEIFNLLKENKLDSDTYFELRSKRAKIVRNRSNFNFFAFHFSNLSIQNIRNMILKFLVKRKKFIKSYLGKVYEN